MIGRVKTPPDRNARWWRGSVAAEWARHSTQATIPLPKNEDRGMAKTFNANPRSSGFLLTGMRESESAKLEPRLHND